MQATVLKPDQIKRYEVTEVYAHPEAVADIVLVHGLNGHPQKTWTAKNGVFWPTDLLPATLKSAKARILVYGYNADVWAFGGEKSVSSDMIHQHAQTLVQNLAMERKASEMEHVPIIFVCHSLGGILVKRALEYSNDLTFKGADDSRSIFVSTYGIIFLGTPHNGSDSAKWGHILQAMCDTIIPKKVLDTEPQLVNTLRSNSETLQNINLYFLSIYQRFKIAMVHEAVKTDVKGTKLYIVDQLSAAPLLPDVTYYGIEATHSGMCKFESKNAPGYLNVSTTIKSWVQESPQTIETRWEVERRTRQMARENQAAELLGLQYRANDMLASQRGKEVSDMTNSGELSTSLIIHSNASIEPEKLSDTYFVKPPGFRPNSFFVGREAELRDLHKMLFDPKRRAEGTSAVLVQCLAGGGKTHLVRQYVYSHLDSFPGGVFWIRAKTMEELTLGFWTIADAVDLRHLKDDMDQSAEPDYFIATVRKWFMKNQDWLLVLDGIFFDDDEDHKNLPKFLPDNKNCSLIYTSISKSAQGDHHFLNPQIIKLPPLSAVEARDLFLQELGKLRPTREELRYSMELVQRIEFLPLVIHTVARRLKATNEPLHKFVRSYTQGPKLSQLEPFTEVYEQLRRRAACEALNMIKLLSFFSQHIPVEMISMGQRSLDRDIPLKAHEPGIGHTLNNTFKILSSFALIDRNEPEVRGLHSSQSSKSSKDMLLETMDVVRLHSVVQDFFVDLLRTNGELPQWLDRAAKIFCMSFDTANEKIKGKLHGGHVKDYRLYEVHGKVILKHATRYEKKWRLLKRPIFELKKRLEEIEKEIHRRTPENSSIIGRGSGEGQYISVFERTSSSSDADLETPGEERGEYSRWGISLDQMQTESPIALTQEHLKHSLYEGRILPMHYPLGGVGTDGYETDKDEAGSTTIGQPSPRNLPAQDEPLTPGWQMVEDHRIASVKQSSSTKHRTIRDLERLRYHDRAGAWRSRSSTVSDPRIDLATAQGQIGKDERRMSEDKNDDGRTPAQAVLYGIKTGSPKLKLAASPPSPSHFNYPPGQATYAPALVSNTAVQGSSGTPQSIPSKLASTLAQAFSPKFGASPKEKAAQARPPAPHPGHLRMPEIPPTIELPYPLTDAPTNEVDYHNSQQTFFPVLPYAPSPRLEDSSLTYPPREEPIPIEMFGSATLPGRPVYGGPSLNEAPLAPYSSPPVAWQMPAPPPNLLRYPTAYPYDSRVAMSYIHGDGYSSQPMSRDRSKQSSSGSTGAPRRPSVAGTEPLPQLPTFSPRIPRTSYQDYMAMQDSRSVASISPRPLISPQLEYTNAAFVQSVDEWNDLRPQLSLPPRGYRSLDPTAEPFRPAQLPQTGNVSSPPLGIGKPSPPLYSSGHPLSRSLVLSSNSLPQRARSSSSTLPPALSRASSPGPAISPLQSTSSLPQSPASTPRRRAAYLAAGGSSSASPPLPLSPLPPSLHSVTSPPESVYSAPEMSRTGSGGVLIGNQIIEFGDFPDKVDTMIARERAERLLRGSRARYPSNIRDPEVDQEPLYGLGIGFHE